MPKLRALSGALLALALAACAGGDRNPTGPDRTGSGSPTVSPYVSSGSCWVTQASLEALFAAALQNVPTETDPTTSIAQAATSQLRAALGQFERDPADVPNLVANLKSFLDQRLAQRQFQVLQDASLANDGFALVQLNAMKAAIDYLFSTDPNRACPPGIAGPAGGLFFSDDFYAGTALPAGAVDEPVTVTFEQLNTPLPTDLTQYPLFFRIEVRRLSTGEPYGPLGVPANVAVCLQGEPGANLDLRLARGTGGTHVGDIEILPAIANFEGSALFNGLACDDFAGQALTPAFYPRPTASLWNLGGALRDFARHVTPALERALLPQELQASSVALLGCCRLGGQTGSFSPFGAVDINSAAIQATTPTYFEQLAGSTAAVGVRLYNKDRGTTFGLRGETVNFAVTGGGGSVTPLTFQTDQSGNGLASATWTIGPNAGNALTATGLLGRAAQYTSLTIVQVPIPAANGNPVTFTATVVAPMTGFTWQYRVYRSFAEAYAALFNPATTYQTSNLFAPHPNCSARAENFWIALKSPVSGGQTVTIYHDTRITWYVVKGSMIQSTGTSGPLGCPGYTTTAIQIGNGNGYELRVIGQDKASNLYFRTELPARRK